MPPCAVACPNEWKGCGQDLQLALVSNVARTSGTGIPGRTATYVQPPPRPHRTKCDNTAHWSVRPARSYVTSHAITRTPSKNVLGECLQPGAGDSFIDEPTLYHFLVTSPRLRCRPILTWSCPPISSPMFPHKYHQKNTCYFNMKRHMLT